MTEKGKIQNKIRDREGGIFMRRSVFLLFLIGCLVLAASLFVMAGEDDASAADAGEPSLGLPSANMDVENLVPLSIVEEIALWKAKELWGQVTPEEPIACCDEDGDIVAYMWPFRIGKEPFPSYEQIMQGVRKGRRLLKTVLITSFNRESVGEQGAGAPGLERRHRGTNAATPYPSESNLSGGSAPRPPAELEAPSFQEAFKMARKKELGIGEYGTIYVSARYDRYPIPLYSHYLCPYYTMGDLAQEKAKKILGASPSLDRYYFLGRRGQYFEFVSGESKVSIHAYSLEIKPIKPVGRAGPTDEQLEDMWQDWIKITERVNTGKGGE